MNSKNVLNDAERRSFAEMIKDDIEFMTGKTEFDYLICFCVDEKDSGVNILTNVQPGAQLNGMAHFIKASVEKIDVDKVDPLSGVIEIEI